MDRLDTYDDLPRAMKAYLTAHGWHFSKALCDHAVAHLQTREGKPLEQPYDKHKVEELLKQHGVKLKNDKGYDAVYVCNYALAKYYGSSITSQQQLAHYIRDYLDDVSAAPSKALDEYVGRCIGEGCPVAWDEGR